MKSELVLAIESSCDDTSVALFSSEGLIKHLVSSQTTIHEEYGGVVPELATREHLQNLVPLTRELWKQTGVHPSDLTAIAATRGPGLPNALRTGYHYGQGLSLQLAIPFIDIHHHEAHLYSSFINPSDGTWALKNTHFPFLSLIVSGGHTLIVLVKGLNHYEIIGKTIDDAAGECFDKVAKLMGFPYPGGPHIDRLASKGNQKAIRFPRPMLREPHFNFSFSGLKTSVRYFIRDNPDYLDDESRRQDFCASVQEAIIEVLVAKCIKAALKHRCKLVSASGGVIANQGLRNKLNEHCLNHHMQFIPASIQFSTDNAAMVAALAHYKMSKGMVETRNPYHDVKPVWSLESLNSTN